MDERTKDEYQSLLRTETLPQELLDEHEDWVRLSRPINRQHRPITPFDYIAIAKSALKITVAEDGTVTFKPRRAKAPDAVSAAGSDAKPKEEPETKRISGTEVEWEKVSAGDPVAFMRSGEWKEGSFIENADRGRKIINVSPAGTPKPVQFTKGDLRLIVPADKSDQKTE